MNPNFLNRFMKKLTRERVVPTISARVSWLILGTTVSGTCSSPKSKVHLEGDPEESFPTRDGLSPRAQI